MVYDSIALTTFVSTSIICSSINGELRPSKAEREFLTLAYNRFYDLYDEILSDHFWERDSQYRFAKIRDAFFVSASTTTKSLMFS